jgi:hypothetical protein
MSCCLSLYLFDYSFFRSYLIFPFFPFVKEMTCLTLVTRLASLPDRGHIQRLTMTYLAAYLLIGGLGLLLAPTFALRLLLSDGAYGEIMPRLVVHGRPRGRASSS